MTRRHSTSPRRIKILYVMDALEGGDRTGGTEAQVLQLLRHIDLDRFEARLALFRATVFTDAAREIPCPATVLGIRKLVHPGALFKFLKLTSLVRRHEVDLVHIFLNDAAIVAPFFCRLGGARVIASRRDMGFWYTSTVLNLLRVSNRCVSRIVANSEAVRQNVHGREGYPIDRVEVFQNGHDPARFHVTPFPRLRTQLNIGASDPIVGMVANFNPWKRHIDLVRAFAHVRRQHPRAHLVFVGAGPSEPCVAEARALGLQSAVHFLGGVAEPIPVVKHFDVGVLCSESEGSSNAVIEYMGCGKPTVCTNVGGNQELITEGETGSLVSPGDVSALAERINALLSNRALRESMGHRAGVAAQRLTAQRMAQKHMELYERLAQPEPGVRGQVRFQS